MDNLRRMMFVTSASDIPKDFNPGSQYNDELIEALYVPLYRDDTLNTVLSYVPYYKTGTSYGSNPANYTYSCLTNEEYNIVPYPNSNKKFKGYSQIFP